MQTTTATARYLNQDGSTCKHYLTGIRTNHGVRERVCGECGRVETLAVTAGETRDMLMRQAAILVENVEHTYEGAYALVSILAALPPASALALLACIMAQLEHEPDGLGVRALLLTASLDSAVAVQS